MFRVVLALFVTVASATPCSGGEVVQLAAAYEVQLENEEDRNQLLQAMQEEAESRGFHVDHASEKDLRNRPQWARKTFSASVWRGALDSENLASASDGAERLGRVWIMFPVGKRPNESEQFRVSLMKRVHALWPDTKELPIMDGTTIPLPSDLKVDGNRYVFDPSRSEMAEEISAPSASPAPSS